MKCENMYWVKRNPYKVQTDVTLMRNADNVSAISLLRAICMQ